MKFNYRAVSKKDRIIKTLVLGIPYTLLISLGGAISLLFVQRLGVNILYYAVVLGIGFIIGSMVRKIGRGLTIEFMIIAAIFTVVSVLLSFYISVSYNLGFLLPLNVFSKMFGLVNGYFSLIEIGFAVFVSISQATVGSR